MKKWHLLLLTAICIGSCDEEQPYPNDHETVHLAGQLANSNMDGDQTASYWKDGIYTALTVKGAQSQVTSMSVGESVVFIGGMKRTTNVFPETTVWIDGVEDKIDGAFGGPFIASHDGDVYGVWQITGGGWVWDKNGISQAIIDTAYSYAPMAITVSDNDVYAAGYSSPRPSPPTWYSPQYAQCWKNGRLTFRESEFSVALSIVVHGNDVYMAGQKYSSDLETPGIACYWKNGQRVDLTDGSKSAIARAVFVTDRHIYVAGMMDDQAVYWKDGVPVNLTQGEFQSMANCIFVSETDVYVAGHEQGYPSFWKNDAKESIENGDTRGQVKFIAVTKE